MSYKEIIVEKRYHNCRLDKLLVDLKLVENKSRALSNIMMGHIYVNQKKIEKSGYKIKSGSILRLKLERQWVSRGGIKLSYALKKFKLKVGQKICLDIGCSTGGFSDVLLKNGAEYVHGIDVGYGQINLKIRNNERFKIHERTNARNLEDDFFQVKFDLVVCDASFISLKKIIPPVIKFLKRGGLICFLIKPQFEVGRHFVSKGGIIKDENLQINVCEEIKFFFENNHNLKFINLCESPITGQKGNKEFFMLLEK